MKPTVWLNEDKKFYNLEKSIAIPNESLEDVSFIELNSIQDFEKISTEGGCYWIVTNEPIKHTFHRNPLPQKINEHDIIYNGIAKDNVQERIKRHLLIQEEDPGWSAMSIDLLMEEHKAYHRQKAMDIKDRTRVPYLIKENKLIPIRSVELLMELNLSETEKNYILKNKNFKRFHFVNGINVFHEKHSPYNYRVYFISGLKSTSYLEFIEKEWRKRYGLPRLCSYMSGR